MPAFRSPHPPARRGGRLGPPLLCLPLLVLPGCAGGLEFAALGAAANAAQTGATTVRGGKVNAVHLADAATLADAVVRAFNDLGLRTTLHRESSPRHRTLMARDDLDSRVTVRIEQRTPRLSRYQIDVGIFGHVLTARLVLRRIEAQLQDRLPPGVKANPGGSSASE